MHLVPDTVLQFCSEGERQVFNLLADVQLGAEWSAYHSLNLSEHSYKRWAEIDFLLIGPQGVIVLEVKGGGVSVKDGIWTYRGRGGKQGTSSEGPFEQARSARYALEDLLKDKVGGVGTSLVFGFGVIFPDTPWITDTPEWPRRLVADRAECVSSPKFQDSLRRIINFWQEKEKNLKPPTSEDIRAIKNAVRPDVDVYPPFTLRLGPVLNKISVLTEEQFAVAEIIRENHQVIVYGGAGTGKTFLLMQCARKESANGKDVLIIVESEVLARFLRKLEPSLIIRIHYFAELSRPTAEAVLADILFIDEGQDLTSFSSYEALGKRLKGGLEDGCWRWFMDDNNQAHISGEYDPDAAEFLQTGLGKHKPVKLPLVKNVRNTSEIIETVHAWTGASLGQTRLHGSGNLPQLDSIVDSLETEKTLTNHIIRLTDDGISLEEIGIVFTGNSDMGMMKRLPANIRRKCLPLDTLTVAQDLRGRLLYGNVAAFKGLERPIMIVVGFDVDLNDRNSVNELYVAATRANYDLSVIANDKAIAELKRRPQKQSHEDCNSRDTHTAMLTVAGR